MNQLACGQCAKFDAELFDELRDVARRNRGLSDVVRQSVVEHLKHGGPTAARAAYGSRHG
jgi:hypothetical protein